MKTYQTKKEEIKRNWRLFDANDQVLGRLSTRIATALMGKDKPTYTSHVDAGDFVVVINAAKVALTGKKGAQKVYRRHSGFPGGLKAVSVKKLLTENPPEVIRRAVYGMLPDNRLRSDRMKRLKIFVGSKHPYANQVKDKR